MRIRQDAPDQVTVDWNTASFYAILATIFLSGLGTLLILIFSRVIHHVLAALLAAMAASAALAMAACRVRLRVERGTLTREGGLFRSPRRWDRTSIATVVVSRREVHRNYSEYSVEMWGVALEMGSKQELLGEKKSSEVEARHVAEALAKALHLPLRYNGSVGPADAVVIASEDIELPFFQRLEKYPALRLPRAEKPEWADISEEPSVTGKVFSWGMLTRFTVIMTFSVAGFMVLILATAPAPAALVRRRQEINFTI